MQRPSLHTESDTVGPDRRSLLGVLLSTGLVSFNDNFIKILVISVTVKVVGIGSFLHDFVTELLVVLGLLAYILFSPLAGFLADRKPKSWLLAVTMYVQAGLFIWMVVSVLVESPVLAVLGFFLLSVQSTFFSPAKIGILKEVAGHDGLARATGLSNMVNMLSIIGGIWAAGPLFDGLLNRGNGAWTSALYPIVLMGVLSFVALGVLKMIRPSLSTPSEVFTKKVLWSHFEDLKLLWKRRPIKLAGIGVSVFWMLSFFLSILMVDIGNELYPGKEGGAATVTSNLAAMLGVGTAVGSLLCAALSRGGNELGLVPAGALVMVIALLTAGFSALDSWLFHGAMLLVGMGGGLFLVPLLAHVQDLAEPHERGRLQAAVNLQDCLGGLVATFLAVLLKAVGLPINWQLVLMAVPVAAAAWFVMRLMPGNLLRVVAMTLTRLLYRLKSRGAELVPVSGPVLLVGNHITYADAFVMGSCLERNVHFLVFEEFTKKPLIGWWLHRFGAIPISSTKAREAIRTAVQCLKNGEVVCIFPEGQLTRTGLMNELRKGVELISRHSGAPVVPVWLHGLWGSVFSFSNGGFFWKKPKRIPRPVGVHFGELILPNEVSTPVLRRALQRLGAEAWQEVAGGTAPLLSLLDKMLRKNDQPVLRVLHASGEVFSFTGRALWDSAARLATKWAREMKNRRVALALRPGRASAIAVLALLRIGKIPVFLDSEAMENLDEIAPLLARLKVDQVVCQNNWLPSMGGGIFPKGMIRLDEDLLRLEQEKPWDGPSLVSPFSEEAIISVVRDQDGWQARSQGQEMIKRNALVIDASDFFRAKDTLASNLPLGHPAGLVFSLFYPLISGRVTLLAPSGGDSRTLNDVLRDQKVTVFLTEPESAYVLRKFQALDHRPSSLRHVSSWVTTTEGGETDPFSDDGDSRKGVVFTRSLAVRENGCLAGVSFADPLNGRGENEEPQFGWRAHSFGRPFADLVPPTGPGAAWTKFAPLGVESPEFPPLWEDEFGLLFRQLPSREVEVAEASEG